jgi:hypothetical protein
MGRHFFYSSKIILQAFDCATVSGRNVMGLRTIYTFPYECLFLLQICVNSVQTGFRRYNKRTLVFQRAVKFLRIRAIFQHTDCSNVVFITHCL